MAVTTGSTTRTSVKRKAFYENFKTINMKQKFHSSRGNKKFKRFKKTAKYILDNPENIIAKAIEQDAYTFTDSDEEGHNDLGMGIQISDITSMVEFKSLDEQKLIIAQTQSQVSPLFINEESYSESILQDALVELKYTGFRPNQEETIKRILFGRSTLFISPTGSGKSLCYQLPALLYWKHKKFITIVVSPLISLMEDQMTNFPDAMHAVCIHSGYSRAQNKKSISQLISGDAQVVFISPEAIVGGTLDMDELQNFPAVGFVCIDEAHCLSEWSHNFRPAYLQFHKILTEHMKIKTFLGLTATATKATSFTICRSLTINPDTDVIGSTSIPENLLLSASCETNKRGALIDLLKTPTFRHLPSIIVYCNRRDETEAVAQHIRAFMKDYSTLLETSTSGSKNATENPMTGSPSGNSPNKTTIKLTWQAEAYHAGLSIERRKKLQKRFIKGEIRVIVATVAFGMGINKSNIRAIIHYDMPGSFENYVQEIGRAGRDGKLAQCHMFLSVNQSDIFYQQRNIYTSTTDAANMRKLVNHLFGSICSNLKCKPSDDAEVEKFKQLNQSDPHELVSLHKTLLINQERGYNEGNCDDDDDDDLMLSCTDLENKNRPVKYHLRSVVRKHRPCYGHEITIPIEEIVQDLNLKIEAVITLILQIQKSYPQLKIEVFPPARTMCELHCRKGPAQLAKLARSSPLIHHALSKYKVRHSQENGDCAHLQKLIFDVVPVARKVGMTSSEAIKKLKRTQCELVEKTGQFQKSHIEVKFYGNMLHLRLAQDLTQDEKDEIFLFLKDYMRTYEELERVKVCRVYNTFRECSLSLKQIADKDARLTASQQLKSTLDTYFNSVIIQKDTSEVADIKLFHISNDGSNSACLDKVIKTEANRFISVNGSKFMPSYIAKIFQGIDSPNYPAELWGTNRKWWRLFLNVDFIVLKSIIGEILQEYQWRVEVEDGNRSQALNSSGTTNLTTS